MFDGNKFEAGSVIECDSLLVKNTKKNLGDIFVLFSVGSNDKKDDTAEGFLHFPSPRKALNFLPI